MKKITLVIVSFAMMLALVTSCSDKTNVDNSTPSDEMDNDIKNDSINRNMDDTERNDTSERKLTPVDSTSHNN
jgi:hypothetical protein